MFDSNQGLPNIRADINMRVPGEIISKLWLTKRGFTVRGQWVGAAPGVRAAEPRRPPLFGVCMAFVGPDSPLQRVAAPILVAGSLRPKTRMSTCDSPTVGH